VSYWDVHALKQAVRTFPISDTFCMLLKEKRINKVSIRISVKNTQRKWPIAEDAEYETTWYDINAYTPTLDGVWR
jgi:hypothetical protein